MKILTVVIKHWQLFASQSGVYTNISHNLKTRSSEQLQRIEKTYHQGYFIRSCKENLHDQQLINLASTHQMIGFRIPF